MSSLLGFELVAKCSFLIPSLMLTMISTAKIGNKLGPFCKKKFGILIFELNQKDYIKLCSVSLFSPNLNET